MNFIVATDAKYNIGKDGDLLTYLPEDLKRFKSMTLGQILIMGRKTIDSLPGGRLLPGRETWILTRNKSYRKEGAIVFHSLEGVLDHIQKNNIEPHRIFVSGGSEIYKIFLPYCTKGYITRINWDFKGDVQLLPMFEYPGWYLSYRSPEHYHNGFEFNYMTLECRNPRSLSPHYK